MKKTKIAASTKPTIEELLLSIQKQIKDLDYNQQISNKKMDNALKDISFRILTESVTTRKSLTYSLRAEIQVGNDALKTNFDNKIDEAKKYLNQRITYVADLVTIQLGKKIQNHEKRITKLEQIPHAA